MLLKTTDWFVKKQNKVKQKQNIIWEVSDLTIVSVSEYR